MARQQARRRNRERIAGIALAVLGVVVLAVAVFAIRNPHTGSGAAAAGSSTTPVPTSSSASHSRSKGASQTVTGSQIPIRTDSTSGAASTTSLSEAQQTPLIVLNNSTISGLAAQAAQQFENGGWTVTRYGNLQNVIISTCAYYDPADPTAKAAAKALKQQFTGIKRVRPKFPELPAGPIVVVLTGDYSAQ